MIREGLFSRRPSRGRSHKGHNESVGGHYALASRVSENHGAFGSAKTRPLPLKRTMQALRYCKPLTTDDSEALLTLDLFEPRTLA